eukprot:6282260-Prymnesium_polylepis.2
MFAFHLSGVAVEPSAQCACKCYRGPRKPDADPTKQNSDPAPADDYDTFPTISAHRVSPAICMNGSYETRRKRATQLSGLGVTHVHTSARTGQTLR